MVEIVKSEGRTYAAFPTEILIEDYLSEKLKLDRLLEHLVIELKQSPTQCVEIQSNGSISPFECNLAFQPKA